MKPRIRLVIRMCPVFLNKFYIDECLVPNHTYWSFQTRSFQTGQQGHVAGGGIFMNDSYDAYYSDSSEPILWLSSEIRMRGITFHCPVSGQDRLKQMVLEFNQQCTNNTLTMEDVVL